MPRRTSKAASKPMLMLKKPTVQDMKRALERTLVAACRLQEAIYVFIAAAGLHRGMGGDFLDEDTLLKDSWRLGDLPSYERASSLLELLTGQLGRAHWDFGGHAQELGNMLTSINFTRAKCILRTWNRDLDYDERKLAWTMIKTLWRKIFPKFDEVWTKTTKEP